MTGVCLMTKTRRTTEASLHQSQRFKKATDYLLPFEPLFGSNLAVCDSPPLARDATPSPPPLPPPIDSGCSLHLHRLAPPSTPPSSLPILPHLPACCKYHTTAIALERAVNVDLHQLTCTNFQKTTCDLLFRASKNCATAFSTLSHVQLPAHQPASAANRQQDMRGQ